MAGNSQDKRVNDQRLRGLGDGGTLTESMLGRGTGSILFKKVGAVTTAYYRWTINKKAGLLSIGQYRSTPNAPGLTLAEIREKARDLVAILLEHGNPKAYLEKNAAEQEAQRVVDAKVADEAARVGTFQDLLDNYCDDLLARGRVKARSVAGMFKLHVSTPFPELVAKPAGDITVFDITTILKHVLAGKPKNRGKNHTTPAPASNMRSTTDTLHGYLSTAFEKARSSITSLERKVEDPKNFDITINPVAGVGGLEDVYKGDTESLEQAELAELLIYLDTLPDRQRAIALAPIYFGGQRLKMLAALKWDRVSDDGITLIDIKGKGKPRLYFLPFTPRITEIIKPLLDLRLSAEGPFALTHNLIRADAFSKLFSEAGTRLSEAGGSDEAASKTRYFTWKNIRVSAETMLAGIGISRETRAHILSHGRSSVQNKFYDRNSYLVEKTEALTKWGDFLDDIRQKKYRPDLKIQSLNELRGDDYK